MSSKIKYEYRNKTVSVANCSAMLIFVKKRDD